MKEEEYNKLCQAWDDYILLEELETGKKRGVFKIKKKEVD